MTIAIVMVSRSTTICL